MDTQGLLLLNPLILLFLNLSDLEPKLLMRERESPNNEKTVNLREAKLKTVDLIIALFLETEFCECCYILP